jgi:phosphatidylinositol glycan class M
MHASCLQRQPDLTSSPFQSEQRLAHSQVGLIMFVPQIALLLATSFKYAADLPTCIFLQTAIFVACNKVCTGQYFIWYLCLLPLVIPKLRMTLSQFTVLLALWVGALLHWLLWAYLLEFQGLNTFRQLWVAGAIFFAANIKVLCSIIDAYTGGQDKKRQHSS